MLGLDIIEYRAVVNCYVMTPFSLEEDTPKPDNSKCATNGIGAAASDLLVSRLRSCTD